jgi:hypothetical protein
MSHTGVIMNVLKLSKKITSNYFDYQKLSGALESAHVRRDIGRLIRDKFIVRIKKGLYIWGDDLRKTPYSKEVLSNLIYGPSYISLEYALSYHNLIPERVYTITAVTTSRNKLFETPVGSFEYKHTNANSYPWGVRRITNEVGESYLIASPEKALLDFIFLRIRKWDDNHNIADYLFENLRIDEIDFDRLDHKKMYDLARYYRNCGIKEFIQWSIKRGN